MTERTLDIHYSPEHSVPMICHNGKCDADLAAFSYPCIIPGNFHAPGRVALLCDPCSKLFWEREAETERQADERD